MNWLLLYSSSLGNVQLGNLTALITILCQQYLAAVDKRRERPVSPYPGQEN